MFHNVNLQNRNMCKLRRTNKAEKIQADISIKSCGGGWLILNVPNLRMLKTFKAGQLITSGKRAVEKSQNQKQTRLENGHRNRLCFETERETTDKRPCKNAPKTGVLLERSEFSPPSFFTGHSVHLAICCCTLVVPQSQYLSASSPSA
ncbi:hypothetical protein T03_14899 [Trichinella britovi]|uniref:Uncharacterized protein n=1 Tax=Trichinella britovi TaxID=45882 RepID=A0A0V1CZ55_TRIBR|nr:hypothetical protein T03_14899 [Trichinella britovi]